MKTKYVGF